ncbi:MAG: DUF1569 domain-containing protein [Deltaproteobacteria bacterium]|nr:DUF1569 domain-containing protein [Deltaproteobacteria bacterium]
MQLRNFQGVLEAIRSARVDQGVALAHCAQSIELSISGFPQLRGLVVRRLVGPLVFRRFARRGFMKHALKAQIPGAAEIDPNTTVEAGRARLEAAIEAFRAHDGTLAEHFAYGRLSRDEYELAHSMHVADHLGLSS